MDNIITSTSSSSAFISTKSNTIITNYYKSIDILPEVIETYIFTLSIIR